MRLRSKKTKRPGHRLRPHAEASTSGLELPSGSALQNRESYGQRRSYDRLLSFHMTKEEAQELVGESNVTEGNETPYLLRAVGDAKEVFPLELDVRPDGTVWVGGGASNKCPMAMRRRPVVVWLDRMPGKVYVTFYVNTD
jgi:hypothetical protein